MQKIGLIAVYLGKMPNYFTQFILSAANNKTIDFFLVTDGEISIPQEYSNIHVLNCSLEECKLRIEKAVGFRCCLDEPYKLCDYRPAFGLAFADILEEYDWWGFYDLDVILGDVRHFLSEYMLRAYDKISNLGHLMLFKNTAQNNRKFLIAKTGTYNTFFEAAHSRRNVAFDEKGGLTDMARGGVYHVYDNYTYTADIFPDTYHFRTFYNYKSDAPCVFSYEDGKLFGYFLMEQTIVKEEFMYIHLQARNMQVNVSGESKFLIFPNRFAPAEPITKELILQESRELDKTGVIRERTPQVAKGLPVYWRIIKKFRRILFKHTSFIS